jgi:hypothetical protein
MVDSSTVNDLQMSRLLRAFGHPVVLVPARECRGRKSFRPALRRNGFLRPVPFQAGSPSRPSRRPQGAASSTARSPPAPTALHAIAGHGLPYSPGPRCSQASVIAGPLRPFRSGSALLRAFPRPAPEPARRRAGRGAAVSRLPAFGGIRALDGPHAVPTPATFLRRPGRSRPDAWQGAARTDST